MTRRLRLRMWLLAAGAGLGMLGVVVLPGTRWRAQVLALKATGRLPELEWGELTSMLRPGGDFWLKPLIENHNPDLTIENPYHRSVDVDAGRAAFRIHCAECHGAAGHGTGEDTPDLTQGTMNHGSSDWSLFRTITRGVPDTRMQPHHLPTRVAWQLVAYVHTLSTGMASDTGRQAPPAAPPPVSQARLSAASHDSGWVTWSGSWDGHRYSRLDQINTRNVASLATRWVYQMPMADSLAEATALVSGGVLFVTEPPATVTALDLETGQVLWRFSHTVPPDVPLCCGEVNRGVALMDDMVIIGTLDARLIALDAGTGTVRWETAVADYHEGYSITGAPLAVNDLVITGVGGGEYGIRGFVDAYDAHTGARRWRHWMIPGPGEPGSDSWSGDAWQHGGAPTWLTGTYDRGRHLLYWTTGNPSPDFQATARPGDNLFSNSVVALDVDSGTTRWTFQFTPGDDHDWDATEVPVLFDADWHGQTRALLGLANRNGFYYLLDRDTGRLLTATAFGYQTWASGVDSLGRPVRRSGTSPSRHGTLTYPGVGGATNWWPPSYSPRTRLMYVPWLRAGSIFFRRDRVVRTPGEAVTGSASQSIPNEPRRTGVRALDPLTGRVAWEFADPPRGHWSRTGGILSTAGGLVFTGDRHIFRALDDQTGRELWHTNLGGNIVSAPSAAAFHGREYIAVAAGRDLIVFALPAAP